jgi:hypothetical protein
MHVKNPVSCFQSTQLGISFTSAVDVVLVLHKTVILDVKFV